MTKLYTEAEKIDITGRMADLIVYHVRNKGECSEDDLRKAAFQEYEIQQFGPTARGLAAIELNNADPVQH